MAEMLSYFGEFGSVVQLDSMWEDSILLIWLGPVLAKCI